MPTTKCFSLTESRNWCYRSAFASSGLRSTLTHLHEHDDHATVVHCWVPKTPTPSKPNILLIHGMGANALWQWAPLIPKLSPHFNLFVPDLLFFGDSFTTSPDRSESFQARTLIRLVEAHSVRSLSLVGLSYGGFVTYSFAAQCCSGAPPAAVVVEKVVVCSSAVCLEERELKEGAFRVNDVEEAAEILVPQSPGRLRELMGFTMFKRPPLGFIPSCLLADFIDAMCADYVQQKRDLIRAIPKNRRASEVPKITQPTLIIWGEHDQVFPVEQGHRLKRHIGDNAQLVVIKDAGHAFNIEKPKEFYKLLKSFLVDFQPPPSKQASVSGPVNEKCSEEERSNNGAGVASLDTSIMSLN